MAERSFIDYRLHDRGVMVLSLDNPPLNLTTLVTLDKLLFACRDIAADERVRAVVVTGSGSKAFCAGSDISEFPHVRDDVVSCKLARENEAFRALEQLPMPVIAALNGVALGGGAEIALACDIRIMDETARIGFPEVKLGIFPGSGGIFRLPPACRSGEGLRAALHRRNGRCTRGASHWPHQPPRAGRARPVRRCCSRRDPG